MSVPDRFQHQARYEADKRAREREDERTRSLDAHDFADQVCIVVCKCGASFWGDREAEALSLWGEHANEEEA